MTKKSLKKVVDSTVFHKTVSVVIILCAIVLGIETRITDPAWQKPIIVVDILLTSFFIVEITLRILAEKSVRHYFHLVSVKKPTKIQKKVRIQYSEEGFWNWFDFLITAVSAVAIFTHFFQHPEYLIIARLFRVFRIFRLLEISTQLKEIEKKIVSIIPTVFSFALLLFILIYIYSIIGFYLFEGRNSGAANFSTLLSAIITLFQVMTLDGWGEIMGAVYSMDLDVNPFVIDVYFISFVVLTAIVSLNVFIAVLASSVEDRIAKRVRESERSFTRLLKEESAQTDEDVEEALSLILSEFDKLKTDIGQLRKSINDIKKSP